MRYLDCDKLVAQLKTAHPDKDDEAVDDMIYGELFCGCDWKDVTQDGLEAFDAALPEGLELEVLNDGSDSILFRVVPVVIS